MVIDEMFYDDAEIASRIAPNVASNGVLAERSLACVPVKAAARSAPSTGGFGC